LEETGDGNLAKAPNKTTKYLLQREDNADFVQITALEIDSVQNKTEASLSAGKKAFPLLPAVLLL